MFFLATSINIMGQNKNGVKIIDGIPFCKTTTSMDGTDMDDNKVDGVIYKKVKRDYYKRVFSGSIKASWFGAIGDGKTDDSKAVQKAVDWCVANHKDLEIDGNYLILKSIEINRIVDSREFDHYFVVFSNSGGGFITNTPIPIFTTSLPFKDKPISQLVNFRDLNFRSYKPEQDSYVLDGPKFLRIQFINCSFVGIKLLNSVTYIQTIYLSNCNIRFFKGYFLKCNSVCYDIRMLGCIVEASDGTCLYLTFPTGCSVQSSLIEGMNGAAIALNGARGVNISGNYFEGNKQADIDMTVGDISCGGVAIIGNFFTNQNKDGNLYSILWPKSDKIKGAVSYGNYSHSRLHFFSSKNINVQIADSARYRITNFDVNGLEIDNESLIP